MILCLSNQPWNYSLPLEFPVIMFCRVSCMVSDIRQSIIQRDSFGFTKIFLSILKSTLACPFCTRLFVISFLHRLARNFSEDVQHKSFEAVCGNRLELLWTALSLIYYDNEICMTNSRLWQDAHHWLPLFNPHTPSSPAYEVWTGSWIERST